MATATTGELSYIREMDGMARIKVIGVGGWRLERGVADVP